jgi:hypothetical protein
MITLLDADGNETTFEAWQLVTAITASAERRMSNYGNGGGHFQSLTATLPGQPASLNDVVTLAHDLHDMAIDIVATRMRRPDINGDSHNDPPPAETEKAEPPADGPFEEQFPTAKEKQAAADGTGKHQLPLDRAPKAKERQPGQWWTEAADSYTWKDAEVSGGGTKEKIGFYKDGLDFPVATIYEGSPRWPESWLEHMQKTGERLPFKSAVYIVSQVSERKNKAGNYYVDVVKLTTESQRALPEAA